MRGAAVTARRDVVPSSVLGMLVFVGAEVMFFAGLISAFTISRAGARPGVWSLPAEPLLPAVSTLINTAALVASAILMFVAGRQFQRQPSAAGRTLLLVWVLGAVFVLLQGREWWGLLSQGLTLWSSPLGAFFYLIVGIHALHAVAALGGIGFAWAKLRRGTLTPGLLLGTQVFWFFVVAIWPVIYLRVYF